MIFPVYTAAVFAQLFSSKKLQRKEPKYPTLNSNQIIETPLTVLHSKYKSNPPIFLYLHVVVKKYKKGDCPNSIRVIDNPSTKRPKFKALF